MTRFIRSFFRRLESVAGRISVLSRVFPLLIAYEQMFSNFTDFHSGQ